MMKYLFLFTIVLLIIPFYIFSNNKEEVFILESYFDVIEVVDNEEDYFIGLSNRKSLSKKHLMLFTHNFEDTYGFWMKDMFFPIDIIWLDKQKEIVHIERNISPETYPKTFYPEKKSLYTIEINANLTDELGLSVGDKVDFSLK